MTDGDPDAEFGAPITCIRVMEGAWRPGRSGAQQGRVRGVSRGRSLGIGTPRRVARQHLAGEGVAWMCLDIPRSRD